MFRAHPANALERVSCAAPFNFLPLFIPGPKTGDANPFPEVLMWIGTLFGKGETL